MFEGWEIVPLILCTVVAIILFQHIEYLKNKKEKESYERLHDNEAKQFDKLMSEQQFPNGVKQ